jgi:predicted lysophospholipase L1 biosynthesis ABC-type transport system permease subunit
VLECAGHRDRALFPVVIDGNCLLDCLLGPSGRGCDRAKVHGPQRVARHRSGLARGVPLAGLQLCQSGGKEFGVRQALGASRARLVRQLVTESLVLASAGGASGLFVAWLRVKGLRAILPVNILRAAQLSLAFPVLAVAIALSLATGLVFGLAPAWAAARTDPQTSLRQGRGATSSSGRLRQALVAGEFALAAMLVGSAGLLLASFQRLHAVGLGFQPRDVLTARISLPSAKYSRTGRALSIATWSSR